MTVSLTGHPAPPVTAIELFVPTTTRGEDAHLPFATLQDAKNFSGVSPACAAIVERFFSNRARDLRREISSSELPRNRADTPELAILRDHFHEAEAIVTIGFPGLLPKKRDAAIAKLFFSKLSYSMQRDAPLAVSKRETARITETTSQFIKTSQDLETLEKFIPYIDACVEEITSRMRDEITRTRASLELELEPVFPGILEIFDQLLTGTFTRPTEEVVRAKLADIAAEVGMPLLPAEILNQNVEILVNAPEALIQGLTATNIRLVELMGEGIQRFVQAANRSAPVIENWNRIKALPSGTSREIPIKAEQVREAAGAFFTLNVGGNDITFKGGRFTQILPEMAVAMQSRRTVSFENNSFRRVPLLPSHIQTLSMEGNFLKSFENLRTLPDLRILNLAKTGLYAVPLALEAIAPRLTQIDLSGNNLIEVPESIILVDTDGFVKHVDLSTNPIIYLSPVLCYGRKCRLVTDRDGEDLIFDMLYQGKSSLAKLYHYFVRPTNTYNREEAAELLSKLSPDNLNLVYQRVKVESGEFLNSDMQWGERHAFDDLSILARAVRSAILTKLENLSAEEQATVYGRINNIGQPVAHTPVGDKYAKACMTRLADALSLEVTDAPPNRALISTSRDYLKALAGILSYIQQFHRSYPISSATLEPVEVIEKARKRLDLHILTNALSDKHQEFRSALEKAIEDVKFYNSLSAESRGFRPLLEEVGAECPYIISSLESRVRAEIPEFCRGPKEVLEVELETARDVIRIIKRDDYLGTDYDQELKFIFLGYRLTDGLELQVRLFTEGPFIRETFHELFEQMTNLGRNNLLRHLWDLSPDKDMTLVEEQDKLEWAMNHRLSDLRILGQAVQRLIIQKYNDLAGQEKSAVNRMIHQLAEFPQAESPEAWGQTHALDSLSRLAAAMFHTHV